MTNYAQAAKAFMDAQRKIQTLQGKALQMSSDLRSPESLNPGKINEHSWPSRDEVLKTLQDYKAARDMELTIYNALPKDDKDVTRRPEGVIQATQPAGR